jgi:hypothetical protein
LNIKLKLTDALKKRIEEHKVKADKLKQLEESIASSDNLNLEASINEGEVLIQEELCKSESISTLKRQYEEAEKTIK